MRQSPSITLHLPLEIVALWRLALVECVLLIGCRHLETSPRRPFLGFEHPSIATLLDVQNHPKKHTPIFTHTPLQGRGRRTPLALSGRYAERGTLRDVEGRWGRWEELLRLDDQIQLSEVGFQSPKIPLDARLVLSR